MGVLAGYVSQSLPAAYPSGVPGAGTEGATWRWVLAVRDSATGDDIDLTGVTGTCKILTSDLATVLLVLTVVCGSGSIEILADESDTIGLADGATSSRACRWYLHLDDGLDQLQMWISSESGFVVYPAGA